MIIKLATSFSPDIGGMDKYNKEALKLAEQITSFMPNTSIYEPNNVSERDFRDRAFIVLPELLRAKSNSTNAKRLLCYLITQARKRHIIFILLSPYMSSINYSDSRIDICTEIYITDEHCFKDLIYWIKRE